MTDGADDTQVDETGTVGSDVAEGQATDQSSSPIWDAYIQEQDVPAPAQSFVRDALRYHDSQVTPKLQEFSELRKQHEKLAPYGEIEGFDQWAPDDLAQALPILNALMDEERAPDVVRRMAEELGLIDADDDGLEGYGDEIDGDDEESGPPAWFQEQFAPVQEFVQQMQQREQQQQAQQYIDSAFAGIEQELGRKLNEDELDDLRDRAEGYARRGDQDPIKSAWERQKSLKTSVEKGIFARKNEEPGQAEVGHSAPPAQAARNGDLSLEEQAQQALMDRIRALDA
jgi:hypothetical protein